MLAVPFVLNGKHKLSCFLMSTQGKEASATVQRKVHDKNDFTAATRKQNRKCRAQERSRSVKNLRTQERTAPTRGWLDQQQIGNEQSWFHCEMCNPAVGFFCVGCTCVGVLQQWQQLSFLVQSLSLSIIIATKTLLPFGLPLAAG